MKLHRNLALGIIEGLQHIFTDKVALRIELSRLLKQNRKWGSRDRRLLGQILLDCIRWKRTYAYLGEIKENNLHYNWKLLGVWLLLKGEELPNWKELKDLEGLAISLPLDLKLTERKIRHSIPDWLDESALETFGEAEWEKEIKALNTTAPLVIRVNDLKTTPEKLIKILNNKFEIQASKIEGYPSALLLKEHYKITHLDPYKKGFFEIQDANSQLVAQWADPKPGMKVIDACAGAGGKTLHMAALMGNKGNIIALDDYDEKLAQLVKRANRNRINIIQTHSSEKPEIFELNINRSDVVLVDVPCSGLGVLRRNPATKWHMDPNRIRSLVLLQQKIIRKNAPLVKKGGTLVYATCSILKQENESQIKAFLNTAEGERFSVEKEKTYLSHKTGFDGFYIARLIAQ